MPPAFVSSISPSLSRVNASFGRVRPDRLNRRCSVSSRPWVTGTPARSSLFTSHLESLRERWGSPKSHSADGAAGLKAVLGPLSSLASTGVGILVLGFIVFVHETGHFLAARWQNIRVENFSIGFGPTLAEWTSPDGILFSLRALPLGGYVSFPERTTIDEETEEEIVDDSPDLLQNRPIYQRAIVISAGVIANVLLAWASIFTSVSTVGIPKYDFSPGVLISDVKEGAGQQAGLRKGDIILKVDDETIPSSLDNAGQVAEKIRTSKGEVMNFLLLRDDHPMLFQVKAKCCSPDGGSALGVSLVPNVNIMRARPPSVLASMKATNDEVVRLTVQTVAGLKALVSNFSATSKQLSGPVGVISLGADLARNDAASLLTFCAVISLNLAVINILPIPALDGGQLTFLLVEWLRGSPLSLKLQNTVNTTALLLFIALSGVLFLGDLEKLQVLSAISKLFG